MKFQAKRHHTLSEIIEHLLTESEYESCEAMPFNVQAFYYDVDYDCHDDYMATLDTSDGNLEMWHRWIDFAIQSLATRAEAKRIVDGALNCVDFSSDIAIHEAERFEQRGCDDYHSRQ